MKPRLATYLFLLNLCFIPINLIAHIFPFETPLARYLSHIDTKEINSNLDLVDCIYIINLNERPEKWKKTSDLFSQKGIKINRVSAINGWKIPTDVQRELVGSYPIRLRGGQFGCLLSHISVIKDAYQKGFKIIWVLEDDVEFIEDVHQISHLLQKLSEIDPDWDVFYTDIDSKNDKGEYIFSLSSDFRPDGDYFPLSYYTSRIPVSDEIMKIGQRFGMYSVLISQKGIKKILEYFTHVYVWTAYDIDIHYIPGIREYSVMKEIVSIHCQSISDTEIELK